MNCGSNKNVLMRNLSFVTWRSWSLFFGKRWDLRIFAKRKFGFSQLIICDPLQRPFLRWFVTAQLWLNFTWQSLHLNGFPSSPWWSFSCLRAAFAVVKPFLHLVQLNSLVRTLVGWHLELFCNIEELNFLFKRLNWFENEEERALFVFIIACVCSPDARRVAVSVLWKIHNGRKSRVEFCPGTGDSYKGCTLCQSSLHTLYMRAVVSSFARILYAFHECGSTDSASHCKRIHIGHRNVLSFRGYSSHEL